MINMKYNWLFKTGCISMAIMLGLGARYGHTGALEPAGVIMFNKAQTYHIVNSNSSHNLAVGLFAGVEGFWSSFVIMIILKMDFFI